MTITSITRAEAALQPYVPLVAQLTGKDTTLQRILPLMELIGSPHQRVRAIHIAGTSGKTSTAYYTAALLQTAGKSVGLTVSPHVDSITERVQINGQPLTDEDFCNQLGDFLELIKDMQSPPSYFELLYAFAIWVFDKHHLDYVVVETGMGGLHDATNVISRPDKVCVVTDIGYDHMQVLGHSLPEITRQKIGITHPGNQVLMYEQDAEIMSEVRSWVSEHDAKLSTTTQAAERRLTSVDLSRLPAYQQRNWLLAKYAYHYLEIRDNLQHLTSQVLAKTLLLQIPGRMDVFMVNGKNLVMDGAHNEQKMTAFVGSYRALYPDAKPAVLIALKTGKEYEAVTPLLAGLAERVIVTTFNTSQDLPAVSMDPDKLADAFRVAGAHNVLTSSDQNEALAALLATPQKDVIITGSFYLLAQLRDNKLLHKHDTTNRRHRPPQRHR